jgi:hypothetical protein
MKKHMSVLSRSIIALGLVSVVGSASAAVTYSFSGTPATVGSDTTGQGFTSQASMVPANTPFQIPTLNASISFLNALPLGTTTNISYESGGYNTVTSGAGGVTAFSASGYPVGAPATITSNLTTFFSGPNVVSVNNISTVSGSLTTDATGQITAWDLDFITYRVSNAGNSNVIWTGPAADKPLNFPSLSTSSQLMGVYINSVSFNLATNGLTAVDGNTAINAITATVFDQAFLDAGQLQANRYSRALGTWSSNQVVPVPLPSGLALVLAGALGLVAYRKRRASSASGMWVIRPDARQAPSLLATRSTRACAAC